MEAIILAGGAGTRLRPVVDAVPKPLAPINGRPFLELQLDYWIGQGISRCILSVGYLKEQIQHHFGSLYKGCQIDYAEEPQPLGTGGGMLLAMQKLQLGRFLVLNGDTLFKADLAAMKSFHDDRRALLTLAVCHLQNTGRYTGLLLDGEDRVTELRVLSPASIANGGVYLMDRSCEKELPWTSGTPFSLESDLLPLLLQKGKRIFGFKQDAMFIDIGVPEDYVRAQTLLAT